MIQRTWMADADDPLGEYPPEIREDVRAALSQIVSAYEALGGLVGAREAHGRLCQIADELKPTRRRKRVHDARYNAELRLAYQQAPRGTKKDALTKVMVRHRRYVSPGTIRTAVRQVLRMLRRPMRIEEMMALPINALRPPKGDK